MSEVIGVSDQLVRDLQKENKELREQLKKLDKATLGSQSANDFYRLVGGCLTDSQVLNIWEEHRKQEAIQSVRAGKTGRGKVTNNYRSLRWLFYRANPNFEQKFTLTDLGELCRKGAVEEDPEIQQVLDLVPGPQTKVEAKKVEAKKVEVKKVEHKKVEPQKAEDKKVKAYAEQPSVEAATKPQPNPAPPPVSTLSPTERAILMRVPIIEPAMVLTAADKEVIDQAAQEAERQFLKKQKFVEWACKFADAEADILKTKKGEELWSNAVTVEAFPDDPSMKIVFIRSSTAPMRGTHGPIVKYDYRAFGKPVTLNHDKRFLVLNGDWLIRSRKPMPSQEYYVKALEFHEGMYFKGEFTVNNESRPDLMRYLAIQEGKVCEISEEQYREYENRAASRSK